MTMMRPMAEFSWSQPSSWAGPPGPPGRAESSLARLWLNATPPRQLPPRANELAEAKLEEAALGSQAGTLTPVGIQG